LNKYFYVPGKNPDSAQFLSNIRVSMKEDGVLVSSILVQGIAPGCKNFLTEYRLYHGVNRLDIVNTLEKIAIREKEGVHFGFPFSISDGVIRYDVANSIVKPETDQLPGSCKNFFSVQSVVDISNNSYGISLATPDAPLIEIGAINAEKPWMKTIEPSQTVYSYVMNNYWHTNYKADQEGSVTFRYSIMPHTQFRSDDVLKFGIEQRQPLIVAPASVKPISALCTIEPNGVIINSIKPIAGTGSWLAQIYNASNEIQHASIHWNKLLPVEMCLSTVDGTTGKKIQATTDIPAYGSRFIRIDRKQ
jgi:alpha-mannosidase